MGEARDYYGDTGDNWGWIIGEDDCNDPLNPDSDSPFWEDEYELAEKLKHEQYQWDKTLRCWQQCPTEFFYLLYTPSTQRLKFGKAKDKKTLFNRWAERRRQCGETILMGTKQMRKPELEEKEWKRYFQDILVSIEVLCLLRNQRKKAVKAFAIKRHVNWNPLTWNDRQLFLGE